MLLEEDWDSESVVMDGSFTPTRKHINVSQLYTTLIDIREHIKIDDQYEGLYFKILRNLSNTKRIRIYISHEFDLKLSIGKTQNLAAFVHLCYNFAKTTRIENFEYCLLPPLEFDYIPWQRCIIVLQNARKSKRAVISVDYKFRNGLNKSLPRDDDTPSSADNTLILPSIPSSTPMLTKPTKQVESPEIEPPPNKQLTKAAMARKAKKESRLSAGGGEFPMLV